MAFKNKSSMWGIFFLFIIGYINLWPIHAIFFRILVWIFIFSICMVFNFKPLNFYRDWQLIQCTKTRAGPVYNFFFFSLRQKNNVYVLWSIKSYLILILILKFRDKWSFSIQQILKLLEVISNFILVYLKHWLTNNLWNKLFSIDFYPSALWVSGVLRSSVSVCLFVGPSSLLINEFSHQCIGIKKVICYISMPIGVV